jgi:hypothetical protein
MVDGAQSVKVESATTRQSSAPATSATSGRPGMLERRMLDLQRFAGNQAVNRPLANTRPKRAVGTGSAPIQRDVGFEFEVDNTVHTWKKKTVGGYTSLTKRERVLNGAGFYVEGDGLPNGGSSWEFVVNHVTDDLAGLNALIAARTNVDGVVYGLRKRRHR